MNQTIKQIIIFYFLFIFIINISFWMLCGFKFEPIYSANKNGVVLKIPSLNYAMVFAHGFYDNNSYSKAHYTKLGKTILPTKQVIDKLYQEGYNKIWLSQCETGNSDYMIEYHNGTKVQWYDYVSRNKKQGLTMPIFIGLGFIRLSI